ncbi:MAG: hypothetical protein J6W22_05320 [Fibrobacter sp.]|nr:hypothetical protein [Fibrobacter sp.]
MYTTEQLVKRDALLHKVTEAMNQLPKLDMVRLRALCCRTPAKDHK